MKGLSDIANLDSCGCCDPNTPDPSIDNPPGLAALSYRIGTHSEFLRRLIVRLPKWTIPDGDHARQRPLGELTTRSSDDPMIALLDAWATVGDVLTFYQERIANEGFLRTATERMSVLELARAIGYELDPGVAASTYLVFTVDEADSLPESAVVPAGTQVQSIPTGNDELPQTFETTDEFEARVDWNAIEPRTTEPQKIEFGTTELYLHGVNLNLDTGDGILIAGRTFHKGDPRPEQWDFRYITEAEPFPAQAHTRVSLDEPLAQVSLPGQPATDQFDVFVFRRRASLFGHNAPDWKAMPKDVQEAYEIPLIGEEPTDDEKPKVITEWPGFGLPVSTNSIHLDTVYPEITPKSWVVLSQAARKELHKVHQVTVASQTDFTLTAKTTRLTFHHEASMGSYDRRAAVVFVESERLVVAGTPIDAEVGNSNTIQLNGIVAGLQRDQVIVVSGKERDDEQSETISEVAKIDSVAHLGLGDESLTEVTLQSAILGSYERSTVTIFANVVPTTHGETVSGEVLGSGDGSLPFQKFNLRKPPLTFVSASSGSESTLSVRIDRVEWQQLPSLFRAGPDSRSYTVRINDKAEPTVLFGDGEDGARIPTGQENIVATYRSGIGGSGNVSARSLSLLKTKPFGIRSVTNPRKASGGEDPERLADARQNAPVTVLTLDRVVSLRDYEDFARSFPGIGKAHADIVSIGEAEIVHLTIATSDGKVVEEPLFGNLFNAIADRRDPLQPFRLGRFEALQVVIDAGLWVDPSYQWEFVQQDVKQELRSAFAFDTREFAQPVSAAEVIQVMQSVGGVVAVDLNRLGLIDDVGDPKKSLATVLPARPARFEGKHLLLAQILLMNDFGILLREMKP